MLFIGGVRASEGGYCGRGRGFCDHGKSHIEIVVCYCILLMCSIGILVDTSRQIIK